VRLQRALTARAHRALTARSPHLRAEGELLGNLGGEDVRVGEVLEGRKRKEKERGRRQRKEARKETEEGEGLRLLVRVGRGRGVGGALACAKNSAPQLR
jgi:hypothetical protein